MPDDLQPDSSSSATVSPFELLTVLWRRKLIVILVVVFSLAASLALSLRSPKEYSATAQLLFRDPGFAQALNGNGLFQPGQDPQRTAQTNLDVVTSLNVATQAQKLLHSNEAVSELLSSITVDPSADADIATIKATRSTPQSAADVANAFANGYVIYRRETDRASVGQAENLVRASLSTASPAVQARLQNSLNQLDVLQALQTGNAEVIASAQPNSNPVLPKPKRDAILGFVVGLLLGCGLALLVDFLDRRLKSLDDLERVYDGYTLIAAIPHMATRGSLASQMAGPVGESYRMLREGLRFLDPSGASRCFVITSAEESEGKSTVSMNLASALATVGQKVLLLEADMRRPTASIQLGVDRGAPGLSDLLISRASLDDYLVTAADQPNLVVLPSGTIPPNSADLLRAGRMTEVLMEAREAADIVIVDSPPLLPVADTRVLLQMPEIDGVIMVGRVGTSRRDRARAARQVLEQSGRRVFGLVATGVTGSMGSSYYYEVPQDRGPRRRRDQVKTPS